MYLTIISIWIYPNLKTHISKTKTNKTSHAHELEDSVKMSVLLKLIYRFHTIKRKKNPSRMLCRYRQSAFKIYIEEHFHFTSVGESLEICLGKFASSKIVKSAASHIRFDLKECC